MAGRFIFNLGLPVEEIVKNVIKIETFMLPEVEILLILKQLVFQERSLSAKGQKDRIDILSLYKKYLTKFKVVNLKKEEEISFACN